MEIELVDLDQVSEYEKNVKVHTEKQIKQIADSIRAYGFKVPVLLDAENVLIAGHGRKRAAQSLGLKKVPAIRVTDLSEDKVRAYRILDNALAESSWDHELLKVEFGELFDEGFDLGLTGFDEKEINALYEEDRIPEDNKILDEDELAITKHQCPECGRKW